MAKRILLLLLILSAVLVALVAVEEADHDERMQRDTATSGMGTAFSIPAQEATSDPYAYWPMVEQAAEQNGVNLFRKTSGWNMQNQPFTAYYILLNSDDTRFFEPFRLRDGRLLSMSDTQFKSRYLSTVSQSDENQIGVIEDLFRNDHYFIYEMSAVFETYPVAGNYVVEGKNKEDENAFLSSLEFASAEAGANITLQTIGDESWETATSEDRDGFIKTAIWLAMLIVVTLVIYRQLYESKRTAVLRLYGSSLLRVWFDINGRFIATSMLALMTLGFLITLLIPGSTLKLALTVLAWLIGMTALLLVASLIPLPFIRLFNIHEALKNRKDTRGLLTANLAIKSVACLMLIYMAASSISWYGIMQEKKDAYGNWSHTSQYGIFYPWNKGLDASESIHSGTPEIIFDLYPILNEDGAIFVETADYLPVALAYSSPDYRSIRVNPNYLETYPVKNISGGPITISEYETDWTLLVPESYRAEESKIIEYWSQKRLGRDGSQSVWEADMSIFKRTVNTPQPDQEIKIIWTETGQQIFSFNPEVYTENFNAIADPIIEVMTIGNSAGFDRANSINGTLDAALKIRLIEGGTATTYERYLPLLERLKLDDNARNLVTMDSAIYSLMQQYDQELARQLLQIGMVFALFFALSLQAAPLFFEIDARRVATKKIYGYSFFSRQRGFFTIFICIWIGIFTTVFACNSVFGWSGGREVLDIATLLIVSGSFLVIEASISIAMLAFVESRRMVDVLRREF